MILTNFNFRVSLCLRVHVYRIRKMQSGSYTPDERICVPLFQMKSFGIFLILIPISFCFSQEQKNVLLLDNWNDTTIQSSPQGIRYNEVLGFTHDQNKYAIIGSNLGAHIFQIKNNRLIFVDFVAGKHQHVTAENRDYAVYSHYLYAVCDEGSSSLQIIDFSYLPDSVSVVYDSNVLFANAHTLCVDEATSKLYACGTNSAAMKILDISNPVSPVLIYDFNQVGYVHDCHVRNDTAFLNCAYDGLRVYNFSGATPMLLGQLDFYANQGYNHSGYFAQSGKQYAFTDETEGTKIKLCYLNNLADIKVDQEFGTADYANHIPHEIVLLNNLLFCAYYNEGLRIYDLSELPIRELGAYDTYEASSNFKMNGAWGVDLFEESNQIILSDRQTGLYLFSFPIKQLEANLNSNTFITNTPFLDENRILIPRPHLKMDELSFSISTSSGAMIYTQENYLNWVEIPLEIASGTYIYSIYNSSGEKLESGKFLIGN